jgi:hypothetical protein
MRTTGDGKYYCIHCGFDCTPATENKDYADEECPARDGDFCEPRKRTRKVSRVDAPR